MRTLPTVRLVLALVSPAVTGGASLVAQAVERTDVPARGTLRVTFDPRIMTWNDEFTDAGRRRLGFGLTGDTVGSRYIPELGQLEILKLRAQAQKELGSKYDIRAFHDEILNGGALPLDMLDQRVTSWIEAQKAGTTAAGAN